MITPTLNITFLMAVAGFVDQRPLRGEFCLQVGDGVQTSDNTTDFVGYDCEASVLAAAINAKSAITDTYGTASVRKVDGSWLLIFGNGGAEVPLQVRDNRLTPVALGRVTAGQTDARWVHELRLIQMPVAATSDSTAILPDAPTITRLTTGGTTGTYEVNNVQNLYVLAGFYGAVYALPGQHSHGAAERGRQRGDDSGGAGGGVGDGQFQRDEQCAVDGLD